MDKRDIFDISVCSQFDGWWRYNVILMCGCLDNEGERLDFVSTESHIANVGANLERKPDDVDLLRNIELSTVACHSATLYIYIIPHTLPMQRSVSESTPFEVDIKITCGDKSILSEKRAINQWSGASIMLNLSGS